MLELIEKELNQIGTLLPAIISGVVIFLCFWLVAALLRAVLRHLARHRDASMQNVLRLLQQLVYISLLVVGVVTALGTAGVNVAALVTSLGLAGFALGFALKDALSNLISGVLLLLYRPFSVNDMIVISGYEGRVISIDLRYTILQMEERKIFIPNSKLFTESVALLTPAEKTPPQQSERAAVEGTTNATRLSDGSPTASS